MCSYLLMYLFIHPVAHRLLVKHGISDYKEKMTITRQLVCNFKTVTNFSRGYLIGQCFIVLNLLLCSSEVLLRTNRHRYRCSGLCNVSRTAVYLHAANELITIKLLIFIFLLPLLHLIFFQTATVHHELADLSYSKCYVTEVILFLVLIDLDFPKNYLLSTGP